MLSPANSRVLPKESRPEPNNSDHPPILPDRRHADEIRSSPRDTEPPSAEIRILSRTSTLLLMGLSRNERSKRFYFAKHVSVIGIDSFVKCIYPSSFPTSFIYLFI
ncbi:hypothetical protein CEXT_667381 [Caerostris extrusa]|uniref:Ycf15 n=1 Tax=Caerostris extrusa TaxID=172846 RepID=A0AAV4UVG4_CAEEX|nr:hypothetical protein CEXT_667381 [Caerostris extrusa]